MWLTGLVAPRHVGSSQTRARTRVPCIGRQILNHCTTRETLIVHFLNSFFFKFHIPLFRVLYLIAPQSEILGDLSLLFIDSADSHSRWLVSLCVWKSCIMSLYLVELSLCNPEG